MFTQYLSSTKFQFKKRTGKVEGNGSLEGKEGRERQLGIPVPRAIAELD